MGRQQLYFGCSFYTVSTIAGGDSDRHSHTGVAISANGHSNDNRQTAIAADHSADANR